MASTLGNIEGAHRGASEWKCPLNKVRIKEGFNTRYADPDPAAFERLKHLIRTEGQRVACEGKHEPDGMFWVIEGHQRYRAICELEAEDQQGRQLIVKPFGGNEKDAKERSITGNIGATGLTLMDNVVNYNTLINVLGREVGYVAKLYNVSPAKITEDLKLLGLPDKYKMAVHTGHLTRANALFLVGVKVEDQEAVLEKAFQIAAERVAKAKEAPKDTTTRLDAVQVSGEAPICEETAIGDTGTASPVTEARSSVTTPVVDVPDAPKKSRVSKKVTEADLASAAEQLGASTSSEAPRKMKELNDYLDEFLEDTPVCAGTELVKDLKRFIARKLSAVQMDNRIMKHTGSVLGEVLVDEPKKGGKKK